jgi:hypothetical protein
MSATFGARRSFRTASDWAHTGAHGNGRNIEPAAKLARRIRRRPELKFNMASILSGTIYSLP